jgi:hypothetical protein
MKTIIISIGAYSAEEVENLKTPNTIFYCYDPRQEVTLEFEKKFKDDNSVKFFQKAVSVTNAKRYFKLEGTKSRLFQNKGLRKDSTIIEVDCITLQDIIIYTLEDNYDINKIELIMNCEGEEISIILSTPIQLLEIMKKIKIEFHPQYYPIEQIDIVLNKLKPYFKWTNYLASKSKSPIYIFERIK